MADTVRVVAVLRCGAGQGPSLLALWPALAAHGASGHLRAFGTAAGLLAAPSDVLVLADEPAV